MATYIHDLDPAELADVALEAARSGAEILTGFLSRGFDISVKGEAGNLVTDADVAAERAVRSVLARRRADDQVTGEELPATAAQDAGLRWSIDPLDGTTNFTRGIPYYATSVGAVASDGTWMTGAVVAPALRKTYYAYRGGGAWIADDGGVRRLTGPRPGSAARLLGIGYSYSAETRSAQYAMTADIMRGYHDARALGSAALAVCAVAEGVLDGYIETDLAEYDWAGAAVIAEEAGVHVERPSANSSMLRVERLPIADCEILTSQT
jgi:myo-inositol-1(or 4)-monophosphatase